MSSLPRSTPDAQGLTDKALAALVAALDASAQEVQTLMLVRHGHVVLEAAWSPYRLTDQHLVFSVSKSFTSLGVGIAVGAGLLSVDDPVISFFEADELPAEISPNLAAMRIRHLLTMTTGHEHDTAMRLNRNERMTRGFLELEVEFEPGTHFAYNTGATYMLSAILQRLTGERLLDWLRPRLLEPLGAPDATWEVTPEGITAGGFGLSVPTETLAQLGQLLLQKGQWNGRQLVPAEWIDAATSRQVPNDSEENIDWKQGYGYQFWRCRYDAYRADGAFGQYCLVLPEHDAVLAVTSATTEMQELLETIWAHLLPALRGEDPQEAAPPGELAILPPAGPAPAGPAPAGPAPVGGDGQTYRFEPNDVGLTEVRLDPDGTGSFTLAFDGKSAEVTCAPGDWQDFNCDVPWLGTRLVTSAYGDGGSFVATIRAVETPYALTLTCRPEADALVVDGRINVFFGPTEFTLTSTSS